MATECCQCARVLDALQRAQACNMTWFARSAGWYKVKKSKNWYCLKCVRANQWEVAPQSESGEQYLCAQCRARASHLYDVDFASPPQPSGSCSSASVAPATSATHAGVSAVAHRFIFWTGGKATDARSTYQPCIS